MPVSSFLRRSWSVSLTLGISCSIPDLVESRDSPLVVSLVGFRGSYGLQELVVFRDTCKIDLRESGLLCREWCERGHWVAIEAISDVLLLSYDSRSHL